MLNVMSDISIPNKDLFNEARLKRLMKEEGLSAVIGFSPANVTYLSGYHNIDMILLPELMHAAIYPLDGEPTLLLYDNMNPFQTFVNDVRRFQGSAEEDIALSSLVEILREKNFSGEKIGVEKRYMPAHNWEVLKREFPEVQWADSTDVMERTRNVKTPKEIEVLRAAARATDEAIFMAYSNARPTDTEKSVGNAMSYNVMRLGADIVSFNILASGQRITRGHFLGEDVLLEPGTLMRCDFGALFNGYFTDLARMAVVGKPSERQRETYARFYEAHQRSLAAVRPGITGEGLFDASMKGYQDLGLGPRGMVGHSIGLVIHERPVLATGEPWEVEEGMVMCIENGSIEEKYAERYHIEDAILVTKNGYEILSDYTDSTKMVVID
ncbi:MAG: Xaa-Pro peptidase family protein [SAR202 cluster bacterium]|jgi:Xaa-Pro aminopeptidase|nr:Xaa-Pro peptidase family protein [SAR202 cluster bacterium]